VVSGLQDRVFVTGDLQALVLDGNLLYGLFLATSGILVYTGWRFDNQPGRAIVVALIAVFLGGIINMLFSTALAGGWLPAWFGVLLGAWIMVLYGAWHIQARFGLVIIVTIVYAILVTTGFMIGIEPNLSAPSAIGLLAVGGLAFVLVCSICERIQASIITRRDAPEQSIRDGAHASVRMVLLWGIIAVIMAAIVTLMGSGSFRTLGLLFLIGSAVSIYAALAFPASLLLLVKGNTGVSPQEGTRSGKRRR
jgi:preprotein translocase subunit SecF